MPKYRKNAQRFAKGCRICGDPSVGRGIRQHVEGAHPDVSYKAYTAIFNDEGVVTDDLITTGVTAGGGKMKVVMHVLVRRFTVPVV